MRARHTGNKTGKRARKHSLWRRAGRRLGAVGWLCLCFFAAVLAAAAWGADSFLPTGGADDVASPVVINRVMTSNPSACFCVKGKYYDWIELLNISDVEVDLTGWKLSDTLDQRRACVFDGVTLPARGTLIVYCASRPDDLRGNQVFSGFKLDADGELLVLFDRRGALKQTLDVPAMRASCVYERDGTGEYSVVSFEQMAASGAVELRPAFDAHGVRINELMASNRTTLADEDDDFSDWVELYNGSDAAVEMKGCALSDDDVNQRKWIFPELTLQPGEYRTVFCSGKDRREGELHTSFSLSSSGEALRLYSPDGKVLSWVEYDALGTDASLSRLPDGELTAELRPTPGYENTEAGARAMLTQARENALGVYINEIMSSGGGSDWIELYNAGSAPVEMAGMGLSDSTKRPRRWQFPEGVILPANGYVQVQLTGKGGDTGIVNGRLCADFSLSAGETVVLALPDGRLLDSVTLFEQFRDVTYGRAKGYDHFRCFTEATPCAPNAEESYERKAADVAFSVTGGQHAETSLEVELTTDSDANIYYTVDGSKPTPKSRKYEGPIELKKSAVIKAIAWREDVIPSQMSVRSFLLDASHTVRVVCVSGDRGKLNGSSGMLKTGVKGTGSEAYVEIYEPDGTQVIGQGCLMKLAGHSSRINEQQKGFSLRARKVFGGSRFEYPLFSNRDYTWYKSFVMRASGQDCRQTFMRDSVLSALAKDTGVLYRESEVSVLYVNGEYWGVYNMRERISTEMAAQFHGWDDPDSVQLYHGEARTSAHYQHMLRWVKSHDLSDDANVEKLREMMDIENYLEYVALEIYANNQDLNNVAFYRNPKADGIWRWALFDLDLSFQLKGDNVSDWLNGDSAGSITQQSNLLFKRLMRNAKLRDWFLTRVGTLLATTFSADNVVAMIQARYDTLLPEMNAECKRWGWSVNTWKRNGMQMVRYAKARPANLIKYFSDAFRLTEAQKQYYFGDAMAKLK